MTDSKSRCVVEISTDTRPIVYLTIDRLSTDYRPTIDQLSTDHRPSIDRPSTDYRPTVDRLSTDGRPTIDRRSTDCRPLYRPLCRPISRSTLPTVNKIKSLSCLYENRENYRIYCTQTDPIPALYIPILAKMHPLTCENAYFCKVREILAAKLLAHALEAIQRGARKSDFYRPILEKFHNVPELAQVSLITGYAPATSLRST